MNKSIAIIGHGIAGTTLALTCLRRQIPFHLYGTSKSGEASWASSGLIAPVTGRRYVKTWRIDELLPCAVDFYRWSEALLQATFFHEVEIIRFLSNEEANNAWRSRMDDPAYQPFLSLKRILLPDVFDRPYGIMTGAFRLQTPEWLQYAHTYLKEHGMMTNKDVAVEAPDREKHIVVWATGAAFMPAAHGIIPNKGEALIVRLPEWPIQMILKDDLYIIPIEADRFWVGSYYERFPENALPTHEGKRSMLEKLQAIHSGNIEVIDHIAGIRPTVPDRRPIIGQHPVIPADYLFNGMGTKGTSLAPFWANQLLSHLTEGAELPPEVLPTRYPVASA
jgi:glycine/D-amino acid oxidase-like deaminating enzyme